MDQKNCCKIKRFWRGYFIEFRDFDSNDIYTKQQFSNFSAGTEFMKHFTVEMNNIIEQHVLDTNAGK